MFWTRPTEASTQPISDTQHGLKPKHQMIKLYNSSVLFKSYNISHQISCNVTQMTQEIENARMRNFNSALKTTMKTIHRRLIY